MDLQFYWLPVKPRQISIVSLPRAHQADSMSEFVCETSGSQPAARITWLKNNQPLDSKLTQQDQLVSIKQQQNGSSSLGASTSSKLSIKLKASDHNAQLACRATNEQLAQLIQSKRHQAESSGELKPNLDATLVSIGGQFEQLEASLEDSRTLTVNCKCCLRKMCQL